MIPSKIELEKMYYDEKLSYSEIEKKLGKKRGIVYTWFKKYGLKARTTSEAMSGMTFTIEHKRKIALSNSKPLSEERKHKISESHKGKKLSEEHKNKIRKTFTGLRVGDKHPMWIDGRSKIKNRLRQSLKYKDWMLSVYKRDNFICQKCKKNKKYLNCHHIETFRKIVNEYKLKEFDEYLNCEKLWDINNGITLCKDCHDLIRNKEGEYEQIFKNKIKERINYVKI